MRKIIILLSTIILTACGIGAGTHGSIKGYQYSIPKSILQEAVNNVIKSDTAIHLDPKRGFYNDIDNYLTITIKGGGDENEYTIRYLGESANAATTSEIFICYIYDEKGNGGSSGNDNWEKTPDEIKKKMINLFETKFINKIDKALQMEHVDTN